MFYLFGTNKRIRIVREKNTSSSFSHLLFVSFIVSVHIIGGAACAPIKWADGVTNPESGNKTLFVFDLPESLVDERVSDTKVSDSSVSDDTLLDTVDPSSGKDAANAGFEHSPEPVNQQDLAFFESETIVQVVNTLDSVDERYSKVRIEERTKDIAVIELKSNPEFRSIKSDPHSASNLKRVTELDVSLRDVDTDISIGSISSTIGLVVNRATALAESVYQEIVSLVTPEDTTDQPEEKNIAAKIELDTSGDDSKKQVYSQELVGEELVNQISTIEYFTENTSDNADNNEALVDEINKLNETFATAAGQDVNPLAEVKANDEEKTKFEEPRLAIQSVEPFSLSKENELNWRMVKTDVNTEEANKVCALVSPTIQVESKDYTTQVWFEIVNESLQINATTNLDSLRPELGLRFDNGPLLKFSSMPFANKVLWTGDLEGVIMENSALRVYLGGNEFGTSIPELMISLSGLKRDYPKYTRCNSYQVAHSSM